MIEWIYYSPLLDVIVTVKQRYMREIYISGDSRDEETMRKFACFDWVLVGIV